MLGNISPNHRCIPIAEARGIGGDDCDNLKITFTQFQDISVPLAKAEDLLEMDAETREELHKIIAESARKHTHTKTESKVPTYMDNYEEEEEESESEEAPLETAFDDID